MTESGGSDAYVDLLSEGSDLAPRTRLSDATTIARSALQECAFLGTILAIRLNPACRADLASRWASLRKGNRPFRPSDGVFCDVVEAVAGTLQQGSHEFDERMTGSIRWIVRFFRSSRNVLAHVGIADSMVDLGLTDIEVFRDRVSGLVEAVARIRASISPEDLTSFGEARPVASRISGIPVFRSLEFPPGWPFPRIEWWRWTPATMRYDRRILHRGMEHLSVFFGAWLLLDAERRNNLPSFDTDGHFPRSDIQERLQRFWAGNMPCFALQGEGGIGKTSEVLFFAHRLCGNPDNRPTILFYSRKMTFFDQFGIERIDGETRPASPIDAVAVDLATVYGQEHLVGRYSGIELIRAIEGSSTIRNKTLVIMDNCETYPPTELEALPEHLSPLARVIFTSRQRVNCQSIRVGALPQPLSRKLLERLIARKDVRQEVPTAHLDRMALDSRGRPLVIRFAVQHGDDPSDIATKLREMTAHPEDDVARFLVADAWAELNGLEQAALFSFHLSCESAVSQALTRSDLVDFIRVMNDAAMTEGIEDCPWGDFPATVQWFEDHPDLVESEDGAGWVRSWALEVWFQSQAHPVPPNYRQFVLLIMQGWAGRTPSNGGLGGTMLGLLADAGLERQEIALLRAPLSEMTRSLEIDPRRNPVTLAVAAWRMALEGVPQQLPRALSLAGDAAAALGSSSSVGWALAAAGRVQMSMAGHADSVEDATALLTRGWQSFSNGILAASSSPDLVLHLYLDRADSAALFLDLKPEYRFGEPRDFDDLMVLELESRRNVVEAALEDVERAESEIRAADQFPSESNDVSIRSHAALIQHASGLRTRLRGW